MHILFFSSATLEGIRSAIRGHGRSCDVLLRRAVLAVQCSKDRPHLLRSF